MRDRFSDDKFIEAARVYQNIKAPSDLREKVLMGAAAETAAECSGTVLFPERTAKRSRSRIYRAASLAACMAIMVAALPNWMPDMGADNPSDVSPRGIIGEETLPLPDEGTLPGIAPAQIEDGMVVDAEAEHESETQAAADNPKPAAEPILQDETPKPSSAYALRSADAEVPDDEAGFAAEETEKKDEEAAGRTGIAISVGKLLPAMAVEGSMLQNMEVRLVDAKDGRCTVEITTAESKSVEITVSKNVEDGHWEITGAAEE